MFYWGQPWLYPHREKIKTFVSPVVVSNLRTSSLWWGNGTPVIKRNNRNRAQPSLVFRTIQTLLLLVSGLT